uniref:Uncharacterized protein n=1 Tax=Glycine max TaxID=3847 RepID=C6TLD5_SOYBN|nr:unknown [Glycine max]
MKDYTFSGIQWLFDNPCYSLILVYCHSCTFDI